MIIKVLVENGVSYAHAKECLGEWGLSLWIEFNDHRILLDTGHTNIWWNNAAKMGIDLNLVNSIALSHHHWDHVGGLRHHRFDEKKSLISHPDTKDKVEEEELRVLSNDFHCRFSKEPVQFFPGAFYLGQIERITDFEPGTYKGEPMWDDSALAFQTPKGVVVVSGCSHSGICNICEQAMRITRQKLYAVVGGFHLTIDNGEIVNATLNYFSHHPNLQLFPMHCVDFDTMVRFKNEFNIDRKNTGDTIEL